jgi:hypothetical protein
MALPWEEFRVSYSGMAAMAVTVRFAARSSPTMPVIGFLGAGRLLFGNRAAVGRRNEKHAPFGSLLPVLASCSSHRAKRLGLLRELMPRAVER